MIIENTRLRQHPAGVRLDTSLEALLEATDFWAQPAVLATIVSTSGSADARPGGRMLIGRDGSSTGLLCAGRIEADLATHAAEVLQDGIARCIVHELQSPDDELSGTGTGREGALRILLEPIERSSPAGKALAGVPGQAANGVGTALVIVHESPDVALGTYPAGATLPEALLGAAHDVIASAASCDFDADLGNGLTRAYIQYLAPAPHLLICGAGTDAPPLAELARRLHWRVTVYDHRPALARAARFAGSEVVVGGVGELATLLDLEKFHAAVVMSHQLVSDGAYLAALAACDSPGYVGLQGTAARRRRLTAGLGKLAERLQERLHAPAGLDIGAATVPAHALAIIAEIHAALKGYELVRERSP